ncbi:Na+/H+ antiporter subunit E [Solicola sp. PLA-1-18]|uniref:Na+/H+ antiporter subunit E n=1 Tax=Solicola sp. PLA-1-18 TaxID=3380532 RepID=UPI003B7B564F
MPRTRFQRARLNYQWPVILGLTAVWIMLWGDLSLFNVVCGLLVAFFVLTVFPLPPLQFSGRVRPVGLLVLLAVFLVDLVKASVQVAGKALDPRYQPSNAIIAVPLRSLADAYFLLTAELVSLVPGSLLLESDYGERTLYLHVLGARDDADVEKAREAVWAQERRVMKALASDDEMRDYEAAVKEST